MVKTNVMRPLDVAGITYEIGTYEVDEHDLSGSHAADLVGADYDRMYKTLVSKGGKKGYMVYCIPIDEELDLKKATRAAGEKKVEMIHVKDMLGITGYIRDGCSPIGMKEHFPTYIEGMAQVSDTIMVSVGQRGVQVTLSSQDLRDYVKGTFVSPVQAASLYYNKIRSRSKYGQQMEREITNMDKQKLMQVVVDGLGRSYAPYSYFHVSATPLCADGIAYTGNNIENAAYTPSVYVERCAIFKAVGDGGREFEAIVVCGGPDGMIEDYCPPCGVCRQVMREFCDPSSFRAPAAKTAEGYREYTLEQLLSDGFGLDYLTGSGEKRKVVDGCEDA